MQKRNRGPSRREFLQGAGVAGAGLMAGSVGAGAAVADAPGKAPAYAGHGSYGQPGAPASSTRFGRLFPKLPPFADANDTVRAALTRWACRAGSWMPTTTLARGPRR